MPPQHSISKQVRSRASRRLRKCGSVRTVKDAIHQYACPKCCEDTTRKSKEPLEQKPDDMSIWAWKLKQNQYGSPPSKSQFIKTKFRWQEKRLEPAADEESPEETVKRKFINPFTQKKKTRFSGAEKRKIVEKWGKMWDSALSDIQFDRTVFENNPDGEQTYKSDNERINDGCQKLCEIARMNQNIIAMMMKKFVSGPPNKLYTLNRIEAAQCWSRIINDEGLVNDKCCIDLPVRSTGRKFNIPSLRPPRTVGKKANILTEKMSMYRLPKPSAKPDKSCREETVSGEQSKFTKNPTYWLDPKLVPPVPPGFKEEEFHVDPKNDPTGEIRRDLMKAREIAKRYTRFAHIIEKAVHVIPNLERVNQTMDQHFVAKDPQIRRQTLLHNFFSSPKMDTSPDFKKDALYATILSRNDNPKGAVVKKPYPYSLAEMSKAKSKSKLRSQT